MVFPHTTPDGRLVNLYGRAVGTDEEVPKAKRHDHLPGEKGVFNAAALHDGDGPLWVCEGVFDALALLAAGVPRVVAIFGVQGWRWAWARHVRDLVFALDADAAGQQAWRTLARQAALRGKRVSVLPRTAYGGCKDVSAAWTAGVLVLENWAAVSAVLDLPEALREQWQERVAMMAVDGGVPEAEAQRLAWTHLQASATPTGSSTGFVANFAQEVMKGQLPLSVRGLSGQGVELFGRSEALVSGLDHHLSFLDHVHEFDPNERVLRGLKRFEPEHGPCDPLHAAMILFHDIIEIFDLADGDRGAVLRIVALDGRFIGRTPVDRDLLRHAMAADRLLQKPQGGLLIALLGQQKVNGLARAYPRRDRGSATAPLTLMYVSSIRQLTHTGRLRR